MRWAIAVTAIAKKAGNMNRFEGKKILFLGSNVSVTDMIRYARANGAHTTVADWYDIDKSLAKRVADEAVPISTADVAALVDHVLENEISAVFAGIHEFNILKAMDVAGRCGLPFYCTMEQWNSIERKDVFRELCMRHGVPCPKTYYAGAPTDLDLESIAYPAVLKPVDASASEGVHICHDEADLLLWLPEAARSSGKGVVIVEQFFNGYEFTAHYTLHKGKARLACMDNRYPVAVHEGAVTTVPVARIYPSLFLDSYIEQVDHSMVELCESIGVEEGVLFVQGIYDDLSDEFVVFEAGLRSAGEAPYRFIERVNGINYINLLVDNAFGMEPRYDQSMEDPYLNGRCCGIVSFVGKGGIVGAIEGLEEALAETPSVIDHEVRYPVGSEVPDGDTLRQLLIRFVLDCENREQMAADIKFLNESVQVRDANGQNMVLKMAPERLFGLE